MSRYGAQKDILKSKEFRTSAQEVLTRLYDIPLVLVGGLAVAHYANPPVTIDIDFLAKDSCGNLLDRIEQEFSAF